MGFVKKPIHVLYSQILYINFLIYQYVYKFYSRAFDMSKIRAHLEKGKLECDGRSMKIRIKMKIYDLSV